MAKIENIVPARYYRVVYLCTLYLLTSCGHRESEDEAFAIFRMNLPAGCATLDPAFAKDQASGWMVAQLYSGLLELDTSLQIVPLAAKSWEIEDSGRMYVFHLRNDIFFHPLEGFWNSQKRKLTAADFVYSFSRICDRNLASPGMWIFNGKVKGVSEFHSGAADHVSGFIAMDDSTFQIKLINPYPPFLSQLSMTYCLALPEEAVSHFGNEFRKNPVGTGPFRLKSWDENVSLILLKNEHYFQKQKGKSLPFPDAVSVKFISSELSAFIEFTQGRFDFINGLDESFRDELMGNDGKVKSSYSEKYNILTEPQLVVEFLAFQTNETMAGANNPALLNPKVRQAMSLLIDRKKLANLILKNSGIAATGFVPDGMPGFVSGQRQVLRFDPVLAAQLLENAGFRGGKNFPPVSLKSTAKYQQVMEFIQKSWQQAGIPCDIDNMQGPALRELASKGDIGLWRGSWIADYPDPENFMILFHSAEIPPSGANRMRYRNASVDSLFMLSVQIPGIEKRAVSFIKMEDEMLDDQPVIPLYFDQIFRLVQPGIEGMETNGINQLFLKNVRMKEGGESD